MRAHFRVLTELPQLLICFPPLFQSAGWIEPHAFLKKDNQLSDTFELTSCRCLRQMSPPSLNDPNLPSALRLRCPEDVKFTWKTSRLAHRQDAREVRIDNFQDKKEDPLRGLGFLCACERKLQPESRKI